MLIPSELTIPLALRPQIHGTATTGHETRLGAHYGRTASLHGAPPPPTTSLPSNLKLESLNDDVILLIIRWLDEEDLDSLSYVSHHIRHLCAARLFRHLVWPWDSASPTAFGRKGIPENLWEYVR